MTEEKERTAWEAMIEDGYSAYLRGLYHDAELLLKAAAAMAERIRVAPCANLGRLFFLLGELYSVKKFPSTAETFYRLALRAFEACGEAAVVDVSMTLRRVSEFCRTQGHLREALELNSRAAEMLMNKRTELDRLLAINASVGFDG